MAQHPGRPSEASAPAVPCEAALLLSPAENCPIGPAAGPAAHGISGTDGTSGGCRGGQTMALCLGGVAWRSIGPAGCRGRQRAGAETGRPAWARNREALVGIVGEREGRAGVTARSYWPVARPHGRRRGHYGQGMTKLTGSGQTEFRYRAGEKIPGTQRGGPCYSPRCWRWRPVFCCCSAPFGVVCRVLGGRRAALAVSWQRLPPLPKRFVSSIEPGNTVTDPLSTN